VKTSAAFDDFGKAGFCCLRYS